MDTEKIPFVGGFIEIFVPNPPIKKRENWEIKVYAKIVSANYLSDKEATLILQKHGFTSNGNKKNEYYKNIKINLF